ncbi:hypothetical protein C7C46_22550 [Streptomyces tateyamensis]|uniref:Cytochrome b561 domain-containing protein n=1 Tax=Streptomyces tateyamensis TaxID=565073 RepID=A0A2V4NBJ4_9ACTN|nr:DUF6529 family protein [Streptomyces tateyamensis]PYC76262.1 hypothetical protein C7C46_22550 [Streptomyces tateyamensis]
MRLVLAVLLPIVVFAGLYAFGGSHEPAYTSSLFGQYGDNANGLKARLGTALLGLALVQLLLALWMYRRLPGAGRAPAPVRTVHRLTGLAAFLLSLPIAYHCITAYGVRLNTTRTAIHSITGCAFYGTFTAKVLLVRSRRAPGWALPVAGGSLVTAVALLWYTSALWWLNGTTVPGL